MEIYNKLYKSLPLPVLLLSKESESFIIKDFNQCFLNFTSQTNSAVVAGKLLKFLSDYLFVKDSDLKEIKTGLLTCITTAGATRIEISPTIEKINAVKRSEVNWQVEFIPIQEEHASEITSVMMIFKEDPAIVKKAFSEKEEWYRSIFENSLDAVLFTVPDGRILAANPEACKMFQMTADELCAVGREGIVDTSDPRLDEALKKRRKKGKTKAELTFVRKDGSKFPVEVTSSIFKNSSAEERACIIIRDVTHQKQVEGELRKSRESYKLLFDYSPLPNWTYDNETLRIKEVNHAAVAQYGYSKEEFLQLTITDLKFEEEIPDFLVRLKNAKGREGVFHHGKVNHLKKDGSHKITDIWAYRFAKSNKTLVIAQDLTEWEQMQQELREKSEKLITAEKIGRLGYWELNFLNNTYYWTDQVYEIWERSRDSFKLGSESFYATIHPDDLKGMKQREQLALEGKKELDYQHRILLPDGKIKWVHEKGQVIRDASGDAIGVQGSVQDITEYKTATEKLRMSEARQASLLQSQTSYLIRTDLNGDYSYCNEKFCNDFGWIFPQGDILGECSRATFKDYHHEKVQGIFDQCIQQPNTVFQVEIDKIQKNDEVKPTLWDFICLTNSKGEPVEVQGVGIDITSRVKAEQEVRDAKRRYELVTKASSDAIWDWDSKTRTLFWGEGFRELFGYDSEKAAPNIDSWHKFIHPEDAPRIIKKLKLALEGPEDNWEEEYRFIKADGTYAFVRDRSYIIRDEDGKPARMVGAMQDVTQQKLFTQQLIRSEARHKGLVQSQTNYLIRVDHQGNYSYCNDKFLKDFGWLYENEAVIGSSTFRSIAEYHHQRVIDVTERCIANPNEVFQVELDKPMQNGGMKTTLWEFTFLANPESEKVEVQCMGIDITDRVTAEREVKFQATLLNTIGQAVIATDAEGKITYWNQAAVKMYGWSSKEALGSNIMDVTPSKKSLEQAEDIMQNLFKGHLWSGEFRVKRKDGSEFPAFVNNSPILDVQGNLTGIIGISSDITERKKLEELLEKATNLSRIGSYEIDTEMNEVYWSSMTKKIHGVSEDFVPNFQKALSFFAEEDRKKILDAYYEAVKNKVNFELEAELITKQGKRCWIRLIGQPEFENGICVKLSGSFQDIDKVKKAELEVLRASEEKEKILESIGDAFYALDHNWVVTYWNSEAEKILECPKELTLGKKLVELFDITDTPFETFYRKAVEENETQHFESYFEGTQSWYEVNAYPSPDGLSVFFKDVTDQKHTNFKLRELNKDLQTYADELVTANKGLEQFSYIISHNLRAPVANILGLSDLIENEDYPEEVKNDIFDKMVENVGRLDKVMHDLNKILQVKNEFSENRETINLEKLVFSIKSSLQNLIEKEEVQIHTNFDACEEVTTIPGYLYSIFYNLIFNSIKYRRPGVNPVIVIETRIEEGKLLFLFKDNGLGIDLEKKGDQMFGLYKRFHYHVEGKGMGLFMVKTQVEMLGGKISVSSVLNQGTVFTIAWNAENMKQVKKEAVHIN